MIGPEPKNYADCDELSWSVCKSSDLKELWGDGLAALVSNFSPNIRPKLFQNDRNRVVPNLATHTLAVLDRVLSACG
jgi:hypothetical protein